MERETITITTPVEKHEIVLKSYLIGREKRQLSSVLMRGDLTFDMKTKDMKGLKGSMMEEMQNMAWKMIVVSINGKKEGDGDFSIIEAILNMRSKDYEYVVAQVNAISDDKNFEEDIKKN